MALGGSNYVQMAWRRSNVNVAFLAIMTGLVAGLSDGRCPKAMIVTAALQMIYMGVFTRWLYASRTINCGSDCCARCVARKFEAGSGYRRSGSCRSLGSYLYQFRFFINVLGKYTDRAVAELNSKNCPLNYLVSNDCLIYFIRSISLFALYLGAPVIADIIKALEGTVVIHVLEVVGGGLAAIGIATTVYVIGRKRFLGFLFPCMLHEYRL